MQATGSTTTSDATSTAASDDGVKPEELVTEIQSDPQAATEVVAPPVVSEAAAVVQLTGSELAAVGQRTNWSGVIEGEINFTMWLAQEGGFLRGELTYATSAEPITLLGEAYPSGDAYVIREFQPDGGVSGTLILGNVENGEVSEATWGESSLDLTFVGVDTEEHFFDPLVRGGEYTYRFPGVPVDGLDNLPGPEGVLRILEVSDDSLLVGIQNVHSGPGFNQAVVPVTELPLIDNVASYERVGDHFDCAFDITVFDGFAFVDYVDERFECGFGHNASVEGVYLLTRGVDELETSPFFDAQLTATSFGAVSLGDTWASLTERFGVETYSETAPISDGCTYVEFPNDPYAPWLMMLGSGDDAVVSRIDLWLPVHRSDTGIAIGDSGSDIDAVYGEGLSREPNYYNEQARTVEITPLEGATSTIIFETNELNRITQIRTGYFEPLRYVEGCL